MTDDERRRLRIAAAEEGETFTDVVMRLLDERDAKRHRLKRAQAHPLHRPPTSDTTMAM
jgi:hypothetical protein